MMYAIGNFRKRQVLTVRCAWYIKDRNRIKWLKPVGSPSALGFVDRLSANQRPEPVTQLSTRKDSRATFPIWV